MPLTLRQKVAFGIGTLVVGLTAAVLVLLQLSVTRAVEGKIRNDLWAAQHVFEEFQHLRFQQLSVQTRMVAEIPQVKAVVTTPEIDHATLLDSAQAAQRLVASDLFILSNDQGQLLASVTEPARQGDDLLGQPAFATALRGESFQGLWVTEHGLFQVVACPINAGNVVVGAVLTGFAVGPTLIADMERMTNCRVALLAVDRLVTAQPTAGVFGRLQSLLPTRTTGGSAIIATQRLDHERWLWLAAPLGAGATQYVLARSLDAELVFYRQLQRWVVGIAGCLLLVALMASTWYVQQITHPLRALAVATQRVATGDFTVQIPVTTTDELGRLAAAFNAMSAAMQGLVEQERRTAAAQAVATAEQHRADQLEALNTQLADKIEELTKMSRFMTDREGRMVELKQEVNVLLRELGRGEKYQQG